MSRSHDPASPATAFRSAVKACVQQVPQGKVATYGDIATWIGHPSAARQVGMALRTLAAADPSFPWQRIINAKGGISTYKVGAGELQVTLLRSEGVEVHEGCVDLARYRFEPHEE